MVVDALAEYDGICIESFENFVEYFREFHPDSFRLVCRFSSDLDLEYLFKALFEIGNATLVVEEAEIYISPYAKSGSFLRLVRYGRHKNINIIGVARRATELSMDFRAQTNRIISFTQTEPRDIQALEKLGFHNLGKLPLYEFTEITL